jgi:hypothetical protein
MLSVTLDGFFLLYFLSSYGPFEHDGQVTKLWARIDWSFEGVSLDRICGRVSGIRQLANNQIHA